MPDRTPRISASSYSNTAPLVWSFLYGRNRASVELIMDTAPARSAELLAQSRVDAALVPVVAYQTINDVRLVPGVCVGARERVRSVCLVTQGKDLGDIASVALDTSSRTSAALIRIIFREFMSREPAWAEAPPDIGKMLATADAALIIGDPALQISTSPGDLRVFDLAETWRRFTGLGFIFAMWMTRRDSVPIDFASARDEGVAHLDEIAGNYHADIGLDAAEMRRYLGENITYTPDDSMLAGLKLYFELALKHGLIAANRPIEFAEVSGAVRKPAR
jgi:chorismate dehydratase